MIILKNISWVTGPSAKPLIQKSISVFAEREIDELVVINDEAHHIHDNRLAWFKSIEDIHNRLKQKDHFVTADRLDSYAETQ